jgi:hypothetical protein
VQQLVSRYQREGPIAFQPRSRRPHHSRQAVDADTEEVIVRLRKELSKQGLDAGAETIAAHLARQIPAGGGRPGVPAVSTIWRILSPGERCCSYCCQEVPPVVMVGRCSVRSRSFVRWGAAS